MKSSAASCLSLPFALPFEKQAMTNILLVEREKRLEEKNAMRKTSSVLSGQRAKTTFTNNEQRLQALAAAEAARRAASGTKKAGSKPKDTTTASSKPTAIDSSVPSHAQPEPPLPSNRAEPDSKGNPLEPQKLCTVVKIHEDGYVDLQLSSGEVVEHISPDWLQRLGRPREATETAPLPAGSASRPPTGASRPRTGASRPPTGGLGVAPLTAAEVNSVTAPADREMPKLATDLAAIVNLDDTLAGIGRRGGRANLGAQRARQSDMSSLLSWQ